MTVDQQSPHAVTLTKPSDLEFRVERIFDHPIERVWAAYTEPGPDPAVVGRGHDRRPHRPPNRRRLSVRLRTRAPTRRAPFSGDFLEVSPPDRLVQTFGMEGPYGNPMTQTIELERVGDGTHLAITSRFDTTEERDGIVEVRAEPGATWGWARLDDAAQAARRLTHPRHQIYAERNIAMNDTKKSAKRNAVADPTARVHGRRESRDAGARPRAEGGVAPRRGQGRRGTRPAREDRRDAGIGSRHGRADPRHRHGQRARPLAEDLVRDAGLRPRTARSSASSRARTSSSRATRRSASRKTPTSTTAACGRRPGR